MSLATNTSFLSSDNHHQTFNHLENNQQSYLKAQCRRITKPRLLHIFRPKRQQANTEFPPTRHYSPPLFSPTRPRPAFFRTPKQSPFLISSLTQTHPCFPPFSSIQPVAQSSDEPELNNTSSLPYSLFYHFSLFCRHLSEQWLHQTTGSNSNTPITPEKQHSRNPHSFIICFFYTPCYYASFWWVIFLNGLE